MNDVRDITIARNGEFALVSYENKVRKLHGCRPESEFKMHRLRRNSGGWRWSKIEMTTLVTMQG
jgi:hypothetical protein